MTAGSSPALSSEKSRSVLNLPAFPAYVFRNAVPPLNTRCSNMPMSTRRPSRRSWATSISAADRPNGPFGVCRANRPTVNAIA